MKFKFALILPMCFLLTVVVVTASVIEYSELKNINGSSENLKTTINNNSSNYVYAEDIGVKPNGMDCTNLVNNALSEGKSIYFNNGTYTFSGTIKLKNATIVGVNYSSTSLMSTGNAPLIDADGCFAIKDVSLNFKNATGKEKRGERVLIELGTNGGVTYGSKIHQVNFGQCGTGIYEPSDATPTVGLTIDTTEFSKVYFAGMDFLSKGRKNNKINNMYIGTIGNRLSDSAFTGANFAGSEENLQINQLNVEHFSTETSVIFDNVKNLNVSTIHIEGVNISKPGNGYVECSNTTGKIGNIVVYWSMVEYDNSCCLYLGNADNLGNDLHIGAIQFKGLNDPAGFHGAWGERGIADNGYLIVNRKPGSINDYRLTLDNYIWFSYQNDKERLAEFPCNDDDIIYLKKGNIREYGTTEERPTQRLCIGYSKYYDTTIKQLLVYIGNGWSPALNIKVY